MNEQWLHGLASGLGCWACWRVLASVWRLWRLEHERRPLDPWDFSAAPPDGEDD